MAWLRCRPDHGLIFTTPTAVWGLPADSRRNAHIPTRKRHLGLAGQRGLFSDTSAVAWININNPRLAVLELHPELIRKQASQCSDLRQ
jgi:hypothetical protein